MDFEFNEQMSFEELYNLYYFLQMKEHEVPLAKTFLNIQKGVMKRLAESNFKKLTKGKDAIFLPGETLNQLDLLNKNQKEEQIESYSNKLENEISCIKQTIRNKLDKHVDSKNFSVVLDLSSGSEDYNNPVLESRKNNIFVKFVKLNPENALGLYYMIHKDIPLTEFFKQQYGFALKVSEFAEVKKKIDSIREFHGIKTPRDLVRTIEEEGRREDNKRKQTSLSYAISGEKEVYDFLNGYMNLNFGASAKSDQGILFPIEDFLLAKAMFKYEKDIVERKNGEKDSKNKWGILWTGDLDISFIDRLKNKDVKSNNFEMIHSFNSYSACSSEENPFENIEKFCAYCIEKFADKSLTSKLKIGLSKKYY